MSHGARPTAVAAAGRETWPVRVYRLGADPSDDISATSTPEQRLAMMWPLALEAFSLVGRPLPDYRRSETPVALRPLRA
jgi:hypothetical protein